jgi:hypothetical protein
VPLCELSKQWMSAVAEIGVPNTDETKRVLILSRISTCIQYRQILHARFCTLPEHGPSMGGHQIKCGPLGTILGLRDADARNESERSHTIAAHLFSG